MNKHQQIGQLAEEIMEKKECTQQIQTPAIVIEKQAVRYTDRKESKEGKLQHRSSITEQETTRYLQSDNHNSTISSQDTAKGNTQFMFQGKKHHPQQKTNHNSSQGIATRTTQSHF